MLDVKLKGKTIAMVLPSKVGFERVAMECSASYARILGFAADKIEDIKTAVSEACLNAIEHGNKGNTEAKVHITMAFDGQGLAISVKDEGQGISHPLKEPNIESKIEGLEGPRGLGIFLMQNLMDEVEFEKPGNEHVVKMVKYR